MRNDRHRETLKVVASVLRHFNLSLHDYRRLRQARRSGVKEWKFDSCGPLTQRHWLAYENGKWVLSEEGGRLLSIIETWIRQILAHDNLPSAKSSLDKVQG